MAPAVRARRDRGAPARVAAAVAPARTASSPGVLLTRAYHEDRGEHRTKVLTPETAHGTNPATVTMAGYEVVRVGADAPGNVDLDDLRAKADRRRRVPDGDESVDARAVRPRNRGDREDRPRRRRDAVLRRGEPERDHGHLPARRHGLRHRPLQPAQVVHPAARRRRPRRRADRRLGADRAVPAAAAGRAAAASEGNGDGATSTTSTTTGRSRSAGCAASRATTACSCARTRTSARSARPG